MSQQKNKTNSALSIQEQEYLKDVWDVRVFGVILSTAHYSSPLSFEKIKQFWLKKVAKTYARYSLTVNSFATVRAVITVINQFSTFIYERQPDLKPNEINRQLIVKSLSYLAENVPKPNTRNTRIYNFSSFLQLCQREEWLDITKEILIYKEDHPKKQDFIPKYIPQEVLDQLNEQLVSLAKPIARMLLILQECGMRVSELCTLKFDCIAQDATSSWWLTYYQSKMKKEHAYLKGDSRSSSTTTGIHKRKPWL